MSMPTSYPLPDWHNKTQSKIKRFVIGGGAPAALTLPQDILHSSQVIGINNWYKHYPVIDFFIAGDSGMLWEGVPECNKHYKQDIYNMKVPCYLRAPNTETREQEIDPNWTKCWYEADGTMSPLPEQKPHIPVLKFISTTAVPAIHLAILMGAEEIVLFGVDLLGNTTNGGIVYEPDPGYDDCYGPHIRGVNYALDLLQKHCPIYKTNKLSPLNCEYMEL